MAGTLMASIALLAVLALLTGIFWPGQQWSRGWSLLVPSLFAGAFTLVAVLTVIYVLTYHPAHTSSIR